MEACFKRANKSREADGMTKADVAAALHIEPVELDRLVFGWLMGLHNDVPPSPTPPRTPKLRLVR